MGNGSSVLQRAEPAEEIKAARSNGRRGLGADKNPDTLSSHEVGIGTELLDPDFRRHQPSGGFCV